MDVVHWISLIVGAAVFGWPRFILHEMKWLTQAELTEISPEYSSINASNLRDGIIVVPLVIVLAFIPFLIDQMLEADQVRVITPVWAVVVFSCLGFVKGLFALRKGVYPTTDFFGSRTRYAYEEGDRVRQIGRLQVYSAIIAVAIAMMIGVIRWLIIS